LILRPAAVVVLVKYLFDVSGDHGLVHDVLHPHLVAAADALIIYEGCDGYYRQMIVLRAETPLEDCVGMFLFPLLVELEDLLGRLEAVHDGHVQVH
jgi:hypothetical protein